MLGWAANSFLRSVDFPVPEGPEMTMGALGTIAKSVAILFIYFSYQLPRPSDSIPVVISFSIGIAIGNRNRGEVEYCMDLCISLKSFGVLAAGRLKHSIPYQNLTSCICTCERGVFFGGAWWACHVVRLKLYWRHSQSLAVIFQ